MIQEVCTVKRRLTVLILVFALTLSFAHPAAAAAGGDTEPFTRGTFCMFLVENLGLTDYDVSGKENPFTDVSSDAPYYEAMLICCDLGWITGVGNGTFAPDDPVIRAEAAVVLVRAGQGGDPVDTLPGDVSVDSWFASAVAAVLGSGVMSVDEDGNFAPMDKACPADIHVDKLTPVETEKEGLLCSRMMETEDGMVEETGEDGAPVLRDFSDLFVRAGDEACIKLYYGTKKDAVALTDGDLGTGNGEVLWVLKNANAEAGVYTVQAIGPGTAELIYSKLTIGPTGVIMQRYSVELKIGLPTQAAFYSARERSKDTYLGFSSKNPAVGYDPVNGTVLWLMSEEGFTREEKENIVILVSGTEDEWGISVTWESREQAPDRYDMKLELTPGMEFAEGIGMLSAVDLSSGEQPYKAFAHISLIEMGLPCTIDSITVKNANQQETDTIPLGMVFVTVELTNFSSVNQDTLVIAAYDDLGRMLEVQFYPADSNTINKTAVFVNNEGQIASIKAFVVSMGNLAPRAPAVSAGE